MNEGLKKLFEGSELSEDFKNSVGSVFEKSVTEAVEVEKEKIVEEYKQKLSEEKERLTKVYEAKVDKYIQKEVIPAVNKYLSYSVKEFVKENKPAMLDKLKVESAESFLKGVATLTESFNVKIPAGKTTLVKKLKTKLAESEKRFDEVLGERDKLQEQIKKQKAQKVFDALTEDLTESQREKFAQAATSVSYRNDEQYKTAISSLYESYFPGDKKEAKKAPMKESKSSKTESGYLDTLFERL